MRDLTLSAREVFAKRVEKEIKYVVWADAWNALKEGNHLDMVRASQARSLCKEPSFPFDYPEELIDKRIRLAQEELDEMKEAHKNKDIVGIFDALVDQEVIHKGSVLELGFSRMFTEGMKEVCAANYTKAREDGIYNINGVNTELLPEYPKGKFLKDKRFYQEPNLIKVLLESAETAEQRRFLVSNILPNCIFNKEKEELFFAVKNADSGEIETFNFYLDYEGQEDWTDHVLTQLNYIQNVCKFNVIGEERGYVNPDGSASTNKTE